MMNLVKLFSFRETLERLQASIQADDEQLQSLDSAIESKTKAISDNEEFLRRETVQVSELKAELGTKELGKLTQAEVEESQSLSRQLLQWKASISGQCSSSSRECHHVNYT